MLQRALSVFKTNAVKQTGTNKSDITPYFSFQTFLLHAISPPYGSCW